MNRVPLAALKKTGCFVKDILSGTLIAFMLVMAILMFIQVIMRFCFGSPFTWAEELLRFMFIWLVFLGLPIAVYGNDLTRFDVIETALSKIAKKILQTGIYIISNILLYIIAWGAWKLLARQLTQRATTLPIPMSTVYMVIPVSAGISFIFILLKLVMMWTSDTDFERSETC